MKLAALPARRSGSGVSSPSDRLSGSDPNAYDAALVERIQSGDFLAYEELVRRYSDRVYRLAWSFVKNDAEAEEVVQDTFLNAYRAIDRFRGAAKIGSWLYRITVNTALMRLRRKRRRPEVSFDAMKPDDEPRGHHHDSPLLVDERTAADEASNNELSAEIRRAVDELDEKYRVVFVLRDVEELTIQETAEVLDLTPAAVKSRLHRARLQLRASLERYVSEEGSG